MADEDTTRIITRKAPSADDLKETIPVGFASPAQKVSRDQDPHTKIFRPSSGDAKSSLSKEPVVGWLVVVQGPGRGQSFALGYGVNSIGRAPSERISLDFGDEEISRERHALLTYDPKGRKFYLQNGEGVNLTYLGNAPVLQTIELQGGENISLGKTELTFVPFCGSNFEW
jgi:hypothetical protein